MPISVPNHPFGEEPFSSIKPKPSQAHAVTEVIYPLSLSQPMSFLMAELRNVWQFKTGMFAFVFPV